jgi:hypothetical protein
MGRLLPRGENNGALLRCFGEHTHLEVLGDSVYTTTTVRCKGKLEVPGLGVKTFDMLSIFPKHMADQ